MNKIVKIGLGLIVCGAILIALATYLNKGSIPIYTENYEKKNYKVAAKDINTIAADLRISDIVVEDNNSSSDIEIEYYTSDYQDFNIYTTDNKLTIHEDEKDRSSFFNFGFNSPKYTQTVTVKISPLVAKELFIHTKYGDISTKNIQVKNFYVENETGDISLKNLTSTKEFTVKANNGDVRLSGINAEGSNNYLRIENANGDTSVDNIANFDLLNISNPQGDVNVSNSSPKTIILYSQTGDVKVDSVLNGDSIAVQNMKGDINLTNVDVSKDITLTANAGDIKVSIADKEDNYSVNTTNPPSTKKTISTITNGGSVSVSFTK